MEKKKMIMGIPTKFNVGGQEINVRIIDTTPNAVLGESTLWNGDISIANIYKGIEQSPSSKLSTFYHELTHIILDSMGEFELSQNEKFVNSFSGFLTQAIRTFEYNDKTE